jgi:DNA polymerase III alpha subunit
LTGLTEIVALPRGARFHRADLHIHSFGGSHDVRDRTMTPQNIVDTALAQGLGVIAVTDHNEINNVEAAMKAAEPTGLLVIPGIELSTPRGHLLAYLPTLEALQRLHARLDVADRGKSNSRCRNDRGLIAARGSIDDPTTRKAACNILEGAREAFVRRAKIYGIVTS